MTLLEVLLALAIFLFSLVAISSLFNTATSQAVEIQYRSRATRLAQSKLGEYVAGIRSLTSGGSSQGNFDDEPDWAYSVDIQQDGTAQNLYRVSVKVSRDTPDNRHVETSLTQFVLDPKAKGVISGSSSSSSQNQQGGNMNMGGN
jgi:type II secretory pathway pseudopilin PulG